ncbi:NADPH-dependent FMN reductase [Streptantibioticus rubrisoli]|uniref:NAD(P)H-dependent oxidoreductase n=1 Tax=Streptantibioticus rubrisoli TaxID=1387313 RepID=A0ABT1P9M3_9ACTN|nr:NAD(P)H-dependent oxidoreductase [Streptantibioticus rubrisoli]MCQ4042055.1 NAD(P)H-dependent oxidoreductase [Streptantibioticus rubrisoli]
MSTTPLRLAIVVASVREGRFGPTVANWFTGVAEQREDLAVEVIDLVDHQLPMALSKDPSPEVAAELARVSPRLEQADAFVVVTPEYNHSFPASLKSLIDWHYTQWRAKPVGFVSYGGLSGGLRSVEQLRPIFAELHAVTVRDVVSFHNPWGQFDADGAPKDPSGPEAAAKVLLDQLSWWGNALRDARAKHPYGG